MLGQPDPRTPRPPDEWIRPLGSLPLTYQSGERWQYNAGSLVLGVPVARAGELPLGYVQSARVFELLGESSRWETNPATRTMSRSPRPVTWYAICSPSLTA